jgi:hypothetical protein
LLKHDFRDPDAIWIAGSAPRQITLVFPVPSQNSAPQSAHCLQLGVHLRPSPLADMIHS